MCVCVGGGEGETKASKEGHSLLKFPSSCESSRVLEVSDLLVLQGYQQLRNNKIV